jgi:hypothetical protein
LMGGAGLVPREGEGRASLTAGGEGAERAKAPVPEGAAGAAKGQ